MPLTPAALKDQEGLKTELQSDSSALKFENLACALLGRLLGVPIAIAKSGFQHGGDAGTFGQQGRRLRVECKKYADQTSLSDRELLGEVDHALARDEALEAWILSATRSVPEQLAQDLVQKGERLGVPVVIIDWKERELAPLAALCAFAPDLVEAEFSAKAGAFARALQSIADDAIATLRRNLQSWCLGFESLRSLSHKKLENIWTTPRTSNAELGQDAAGGAQPNKIRRQAVYESLTAWWQGPARNDAPAAVIGWDGVGKTWAVLDWLLARKSDQPIISIVPSSALGPVSGVSEASLKRFLADRLYEMSGVRDPDHWLRRVDYLLKRPSDEGPVLTIFFDGLNQEPSFRWPPLLKVLQGEIFEGRVRVIVSTRKHHFQDRLSNLRGLTVSAVPIVVETYDARPGSELDQMLKFEGLTQADLHPDLIEFARTPRLFKLVVRFRERLVEAGQVTVHRLLWEYGRDSFGERAAKSFSEDGWRSWLAEIANRYRNGVQEFSLRSLGETASRPDLSVNEVYARLSDIIDGQFVKASASGSMQLNPTVVTHALGAALLAHLDRVSEHTRAAIEPEVTQWLDPIAGFDQRAEILRAAVSILVERGAPTDTPIAGVLVTAWLQTQNVTDSHRRELKILAPNIPDALLDAVEQSNGHAQASARLWAVNALRAIPRAEGNALNSIVTRLRSWLSVVSRDIVTGPGAAQLEKHRSERYKTRIEVDANGPVTVLGIQLQLVERSDGVLQATVPSIIEGFPLAKAMPCFEAAAVAFAIRGQGESWDGLKWLCQLNEVDPHSTADALDALSANVRSRSPEVGIHPELPARVAALLLWMSGREADEEKAACINPTIDRSHSYERDYLANPSRSLFALERRHADIALNDTGVRLHSRVQRTREFWIDPTFVPPEAFVEEVRTVAVSFPVEKLNRERGYTPEQHAFEELEPVVARCAPDVLSELIQRKFQGFASCPSEARYYTANYATDHFILANEVAASAANDLRLSVRDSNEDHEALISNSLLMVELLHLDTLAQYERIIDADLKFIRADFASVIRIPTKEDVDRLVARYRAGSVKQQHDLIVLLSIHPIPFGNDAWEWLRNISNESDHKLCGIAFRTLALGNASRFGRSLAADGWSWHPAADLWINHYGSGALIEAETGLPFDQLAPRLAPWRLLEAARVRGGDPAEVRLAADIFGQILKAAKIEEPDPGSNLTVDRTERGFALSFASVEPRVNREDQGNPIASMQAALDPEARAKSYMRAIETAMSRIDEARKSGASLYLTEVQAADIEPVLQHAPDMLDGWLEGSQQRTIDFGRRFRLAEAAFLAVCEALLIRNPARGAELWRVLRATMATRYLGAAEVDEMLHIVFRVPESAPVSELREEVISLRQCSTDKQLFDIAVAAQYNGKAAWLSAMAEKDRASSFDWQKKRGILLTGFVAGNDLPVADAWPAGQVSTSYDDLRRKSARLRWSEACARHWWRAFLSAQSTTEAYAAWILFRRSADRRAWTWMHQDMEGQEKSDRLFKLKLAHVELNRSELKRAMEKQLDDAAKEFLDQRIVDGIGPWGTVAS